MPYTPTAWEDFPSTDTAITAARLNNMEDGIDAAGDLLFNVRSYGAVGNGSTDDTAAIQDAIDACAAAGGGTVFIPAGAAGYVVTQLALKLNVTLEGTGLGSILVCKANNANAAMIVLDSSAALQTRIRKLFLHGNSANQSGVVACVQYLRQTGNPFHVLEDCFIFDWSGRGVDCDTQAFLMQRNYLWECQREGVYISYHDCKLFNNSIGSSGYEGVYFDGASNCQMAENGIWGSGQTDATRGDGVRQRLAGILKASNNESSDNERHGWNLDGCYDCSIIGGGAQNNNAAGATGAPLRFNAGGRNIVRMHLAGGGTVEATLIRFDTDGSNYPHDCDIEVTYLPGSGGAIGASNPETVGTFAADNYVKINQKLVSGGLHFVNSATTTTLPYAGDTYYVNGTTTITSVTASWPGRRVTLIFGGALTFTKGSNLILNANFVTTGNDTITLVSDGSNWYETSRSVN